MIHLFTKEEKDIEIIKIWLIGIDKTNLDFFA